MKDELDHFEENLQKLDRFFANKVRSGFGSLTFIPGSELVEKFRIRIHSTDFGSDLSIGSDPKSKIWKYFVRKCSA